MARRTSARSSKKHSYYDVLKIKQGAVNDEDVRKAYIKLAKIYHPDQNPKNKDLAQKRFARVTEAYTALNTEKKRRAYNLSQHSISNSISNDNAHKEGFWSNVTALFTSAKKQR